MRKMIIALFLVSCLLSITGCKLFRVYQPDVQQGNVLNQTMLNQIRLGMTQDQVNAILGSPILDDTFNTNHWAYVYTYQHSGGKIWHKQLDLYFQNNRLVKIENNYQANP